MESFFGTLKPNSFTSVKTPIGMPRDAFGYIEGYYNRQRIHSAIGYITPEQAEGIST
jgi:putative transposase